MVQMADPSLSDPKSRFDLNAGFELGDYQLIRSIGSGAMADVWLARHRSLGREIALKILRKDLAADEIGVRRFIQEAQAAARLEHTNIVRIYDVGSFRPPRSFLNKLASFILPNFGKRNRSSSEEIYYIAQEYVPGMNLQQYLGIHGPLSVPQTLVIMEYIAAALECASLSGIVHRDVKPGNILLSGKGDVKITDFGLAYCESLRTGNNLSLTQIGLTLGTPLYMSPEQAEGKPLDLRSDIYSFGITCFQMLTGKTPFRGDTPLSVVLQHLNKAVPSIASYRNDVPDSLVKVLERMLAKKPEDRFASFRELREALRSIRKEEFHEIEQTDPLSVPLSSEDGADKDDPERFRLPSIADKMEKSMQLQTGFYELHHLDSTIEKEKRRRRRLLFWGIPLLLLLGLGTGIFVSVFRSPIPFQFANASGTNGIARFDTVEEQWVFASQLGTTDAWKSVISAFPDKEYWKRRAQQQLARVYIEESNILKARDIFIEFAEITPPDLHYTSFGNAGIAWCLAMEGHIDQASRILSNLRSARNNSYDPLTEEIISKAQSVIRKRNSV
ncbi:MAG: serine/threonine-protein kinase [Planctomycetia bacterium]|nr:serine/threonine-protein kinase [Planctomycetia bacterium]